MGENWLLVVPRKNELYKEAMSINALGLLGSLLTSKLELFN